MKKTLPTITIVLYTSKVYTNGEHPIMLRVTYNNQRKYKSLGCSSSEENWNENKHEVRARHPNAENINKLIRKEKRKAEDAATALEASGVVYSAQSVINAISRTKITSQTLYGLFEERVTFFKDKAQQYNTATGYTTLLNVIKRYTDNTDVELFEIDGIWVHDFEAHLRTKYKDTSIKKFFDCLRAAFNYAVSKGYITRSPLDGYKHIRSLDTRTTKRALKLHEIVALHNYYDENYRLPGHTKPDLEVCKKHYWNKRFQRRGTTKLTPMDAEQLSLCLFFCSYYMQGLALVDLAKLKWKDIQDYELVDKSKYISDAALHGVEYAQENKVVTDCFRIDIARTKTNHPVRIIAKQAVLLPFLIPFMNDLDGLPDEEKDNTYVFPIFSALDDTPSKKFGRMTYATYLINNNLKRVGEKVGIHEITFYAARHSYASNLRHNQVDIGLIAQNMGRNIEDIETYLKEFDDESIVQANEFTSLMGLPEYKDAVKSHPELYELSQKQAARDEIIRIFGSVETFEAYLEKEKSKEDLRKKYGEIPTQRGKKEG